MHETATKHSATPYRILWVIMALDKADQPSKCDDKSTVHSHSRYDVRLRHQNVTQFKTNIIVQTISDKHHSPTNPSLQNCLSKKNNNTSLSKGIPQYFLPLLPTNISHPNPFLKKNQRMEPQVWGDLLLLLPTVPKAMKSFNLPVSLARDEKLSR